MSKATINSGVIEYVSNLVTPWGGETVSITEQQVAEY
jgi:hypothetical protein